MQPEGKGSRPVGLAQFSQKPGGTIIEYFNREEIQNLTRTGKISKESFEKEYHTIGIAHSSSYQNDLTNNKKICRIRSHGSLMNYIFPISVDINKINSMDSSQVKAAKLLETVLTRITIIDNRVFNMLPTGYNSTENSDSAKSNYANLQEQLFLRTLPEVGSIFHKSERLELIQESHFLILHISFLERIQKQEGPQEVLYREDEVFQFFQNEIESFYFKETKSLLPDNFILVFTSGRGRGDWASSVNHPQITFRPIEAIINAIEDGLSIGDDYQIKHNLCNLLFGS